MVLVQYACEIQAALPVYRAIKGGMHSLSPHLDFHLRNPGLTVDIAIKGSRP